MGVFICYRRDDAEGEARALYARLAEETDESKLFLDHDAIGAGDNWRSRIEDTLSKVEAVLVVIGPSWLTSIKSRIAGGQPDVVRSEIATCLGRSDVRVIPVVVKGAQMPSADALPDDIRQLAGRNALEVRGSAWKDDTARLVKSLRKAKALPTSRRQWLQRAAAAIALAGLAAGVYAATAEVPAIPISMNQELAQRLVEKARLRFKANHVKSAQFQGYVVESGERGLLVATGQQRPAAGSIRFLSQTVEVDFIVREPYRLVCKGGGALSAPARGDVLQFERHPGAWSLDMSPGSCAWVTGPLHPNQDLLLRPVGFKEQLPALFEAAPGHFLTFCAYSEYDRANAQRSERLAAIDYRQFLTPDDSGKLNPTVAGHVCDERL
jgi:hypothetical protein